MDDEFKTNDAGVAQGGFAVDPEQIRFEPGSRPLRQLKPWVQGVIALLVLAVGIEGFLWLKSMKKPPPRVTRVPSYPMVRVVPVTRGPVKMVVRTQGTVEPSAEISLVSEVAGRIVWVSPSLVSGGFFKKGDILCRVDQADYKDAVFLAEARVADARSRLEMARADAKAAKEEWDSMHPGMEPSPLAVKLPQLNAAVAELEAQKANLEIARRNLSRTEIKAPFNGRVASESVDVGSYVAPGAVIAVLYSIDAVEIPVPVSGSDLAWLDVPGVTCRQCTGARVVVRSETAGSEKTWDGYVARDSGKIDPSTRMHHLVVRVEKPFGSIPPLVPGGFVKVDIIGDTLPDAYVIPYEALHQGNVVWGIDPESHVLRFRKVKVARLDKEGVVVTAGLVDGELIAVSGLKSVTDGMKVKPVITGGGAK